MAFRLYIVPRIGTGAPFVDPYRPKYFDGVIGRWAAIPYGFQPIWLVGADLDTATDSSIIANADVFAFPFDLDGALNSGQANTARDAFELALIPAQWVAASMTWRQIARTVSGMFFFMQVLYGLRPDLVFIDQSTKLNVQFGSLPADIQSAVLQACQSVGYSTAGIQSNTQIRAILKDMADQWGSKPFDLNGFIF